MLARRWMTSAIALLVSQQAAAAMSEECSPSGVSRQTLSTRTTMTIPENDVLNGCADDTDTSSSSPPHCQPQQPPAVDVWMLARTGNFSELTRLVRDRPSLISQKDKQGHTLLHWAALCNSSAFCQLLVDMGAAVDPKSANGQTPLMWAAIKGWVALMRYLLSKEADIDSQDSLGASPLTLTIQHGRAHAFLFLIRKGATLNTKDLNGCGPAHWAAFKVSD